MRQFISTVWTITKRCGSKVLTRIKIFNWRRIASSLPAIVLVWVGRLLIVGLVLYGLLHSPLWGWIKKAAGQHPPELTLIFKHDEKQPIVRGAVVFVHGLQGSTPETWENSSHVTWMKILHDDPAFVNYDVFSYGYDTSVLRDKTPIENIVNVLRSEIDSRLAAR